MENQILQRKKKKITLEVETKAFLVCLLLSSIVVVPILVKNKGLFALSHDFTAEEIPFGMLMNSAIKSGDLWNWAIDLGGNTIESFSFYNIGSIFNWISFLFPSSFYPYLIGWLFILKIGIAGFSSSLWLKRYTNSNGVLIAAVIYAFSGAQCINTVFYHFQDVIALFPLMLYALDKLIIDNKKGVFALSCALNLLCNPVFFFASTCFTILYFLFRYLIPAKDKKLYLKKTLYCIFEGLVAGAMSAFILFPSVISLLRNSRVTSKIPGSEWLSISTERVLMLISTFFFPSESMDSYSAVFYSNWGSWNVYLPLFGMVFVLAYLFKEKNWLSNLIKVSFVFILIPLLNSVFVMFSPDVYARWLYTFSIVLALATAKVLEDIHEYDKYLSKSMIVNLLIIAGYLAGVLLVKWDGSHHLPVFRRTRLFVNVSIALLGVLITSFLKKDVLKKKVFLLTSCFATTLFAVSILDYQNGALDNTGVDFNRQSNTYSENAVSYLCALPLELEKDIFPYRYYFDEGIGYTYYNFSMVNSLPSINSFITTCDPSVKDFYEALGFNRQNMTPKGNVGTEELLSARYVIAKNELSGNQYKYIKKYVNSAYTFYKYENLNALPMGIIYDSYITESEFKTVLPESKALVMLKDLVVPDSKESSVNSILVHDDAYLDINDSSYETTILDARSRRDDSMFECGKNSFSDKISTDKEEFIFYSIPYSNYWQAEINGEKVEVLNVNGLMAIAVKKGINNIHFSYEYIPLKYSVCISAFGWIIYFILVVINKRMILNYDKD